MSNLYQISAEISEETRHVIFFHGLGGDVYKTWQSSDDIKTCWLYWLDEDVHDLAVWTVAYEAAVSRWRGRAMHLADRSLNLLERILLEPKLQDGEINLVGHSLGGLTIKQLLRTAESMAHQRADIGKFLARIRRIAFLATPNSGSDLAAWANWLRIFIQPSASTACLVRNDPYLRDLTYWYREWSVNHNIHHLILTESQPIQILGLVVKPDSGDPGLLSRPISIDADHFSICKPKNRSSEIYLLARNFLQRGLEVKPRETVVEQMLFAQKNQLESLVGTTQEMKLQIGDAITSLHQVVLEQGERTAGNVILDPIPNVSLPPHYPKDLINSEIEKRLSIIRRARFILGFSTSEHSIRLAEKIRGGEFEGGSDDVKSRALAWCARFLAIGDNSEKSDEYIRLAHRLGNGPEITVAEAFRVSANGKIEDALCKLASIKSPMARSAAFFIATKHKDASFAIEWLSNSGLGIVDIDADGKFFLISKQLELCLWDKALEYVSSLQNEDYQQTPILYHSAAIVHLLQAIPDEFKSHDMQQFLFQASHFPLASNETAIKARREAQALFNKCAIEARELGCDDAANIAEDYALWLELRDPNGLETGRQKLQASMRDPANSLRRLNFALQFGLKLDLVAVETEIDRQTTISGGKSQVAAMARFALSFMQESPKAVVAYIDRHRAQLLEYLEKKSLNTFEIEMLAKAGCSQRAEERLEELVNDGLTEIEQIRLRRGIEESKGADPIEARKVLFENSDQLNDLIILVNLLEEQKDREQLLHYSQLLFERTQSLQDAERLALALNEINQYSEITGLLRKYPEFLNQSDNLQMLWCWSLYREGLLAEAVTELETLKSKRDHPNDRALTVNLMIALGDWDALQPYLENEWVNREQREAYDLIKTAQLAQIVGSPRARDLLQTAAIKGAHDAQILSAAYFLASSAGCEDEAPVAQWLHDAATLSGDNGPLKKMSIQDLIDRAPEWNRRQTDIWSQLCKGIIPIFGAAHLLNRSLIDMFLLPALANTLEMDPRKRALIPAYSGLRQSLPCEYRVVAMEATALLTLGYLGLLETVCNTFEHIVIPHSTLGWLFTEKQKVSFHQPSRIRNAHKISQLHATGALMKFSGSDELDPDLAADIGEELASLLAETQTEGRGDERQKLVIRSSPVHRVGSLMVEEADLSAFYPYLCSCLAVVRKLKQKGHLTATQESRALSYLILHEKEWPTQPEISDDAVLYLDDLSVTYLQQAGVLEKLQPAGFEAYISTQKMQEVNALLSYEQLSSEVIRVIEYIRSILADSIKTGKVKVGQMLQSSELDEKSIIDDHPTFAVYHLAKDVEAVIADDRFLNQHMNVDVNSTLTPMLTTLDLLDALHTMGCLTFEQYIDHRTSLRRSGYIFVPIAKNELDHYLSASAVKDGNFSEPAELRAIRENILSIRMSQFLQLPKEANWIASSMQAFTQTLKAQWCSEIDEATARARSEWFLKQINIRGWAHCFNGGVGLNVISHGYGAQIMTLLFARSEVPLEVEEKYLSWIEECVLTKLQEEDPDIYEFLINRAQELITDSVNSAFVGESNDGI